MTQVAASKIENPFFARIWPVVVTHETEAVRALRRENLAGLSGRVLEMGAGIGTNFANYPTAVQQVIAVEPEPRPSRGPQPGRPRRGPRAKAP